MLTPFQETILQDSLRIINYLESIPFKTLKLCKTRYDYSYLAHILFLIQ